MFLFFFFSMKFDDFKFCLQFFLCLNKSFKRMSYVCINVTTFLFNLNTARFSFTLIMSMIDLFQGWNRYFLLVPEISVWILIKSQKDYFSRLFFLVSFLFIWHHNSKLHLMVRLQFWRSRECGVPFYCHYSQVHSDLE